MAVSVVMAIIVSIGYVGFLIIPNENPDDDKISTVKITTREDCKKNNEGNKLATAICVKNLVDVNTDTPIDASSYYYEESNDQTELLFKLPDDYDPTKIRTAEEIEASEKKIQEVLDDYERSITGSVGGNRLYVNEDYSGLTFDQISRKYSNCNWNYINCDNLLNLMLLPYCQSLQDKYSDDRDLKLCQNKNYSLIREQP